MSLTVKRPTIEGMPSPAARTASGQDGATAPAMRLDVMRSLRKRPRLAAGVGGAVFLLAFLFGLMRKPAYQAESLIYIEPLASKVLSDGTAGSYDAGRYDSYFQQQMQTALRPDILASAIDKLPPFTWRRGGESMQSAVARLQKSLKVERVLTSYQLSISLVYASPEAAAAVVNAVTGSYLEQGRKDEHAVIDQRLKLLEEERQRIQQQLGEDRVEQASLGGMLGLGDPSGKTASPFDAQIAGAQTQVAGAREAKDVAAAQYAAVSGAGSAALTAAAEEQIATDAGLNSMKQTISQRKALLSTQMAGLTPSNPIYKQDQDEIADLDRSLDAMTQQIREKAERRLQDKLRGDLQRTADIEGRLNAELRRQTATATSSVPKLQRAQDLNSDITRLTARFTVVDDAMRSLELESNGPGSAHLSVPASVPVSPNPSKRKLILALSLPLGCFVGLFAAVFANRMDPKIYSAPDVEQVLGFSPIGVLPARSEVTGRTMEEYTLRLAAGLQSAYRTSSAQSFVFTAASATMQTTEFVQALARILGTLGFKALVMDASSVLNSANRAQAAGQRGGYRSSALVRTIEGTRQGFAAEELERLKLKYDLLLIDAPPLLTSAETEYLVRCADATILIAESGVTVKTELYQSALLLQHLNVAGVGAVLQELHLNDAEPAFRAAIEAVERLQRGREERLDRAARPQPGALVVEEANDERRPADNEIDDNPGAKRVSALDRMANPLEAEPVTLPAVPEPVEEATAVAAGPEMLDAEPVSPEPVAVSENDPVEEPDQVRPWREFLKRTPEPVEEPEPMVTPVVPRKVEAVREDAAEPVIYFQDRLRPRKTAEPVAAATREAEQSQTIHVDVAPMYVEPMQQVVEPVAAVPVAAYEPEPVAMPAKVEGVHAAVAQAAVPLAQPAPAANAGGETEDEAEDFGRTVLQSGTEGHGQLVAEPEGMEHAPEVATDASREVADQPESLMEAYVDKVDTLPGGAAEVIADDAPRALEPVTEAAAPVTSAPQPLVRREPAPPKMGWFTLKFRGTSERVLRIIPGEEGDEYEPAEESAVAAPAATETHTLAAEAPPGGREHEVIHTGGLSAAEHPDYETEAVATHPVPGVEEASPLIEEHSSVPAEELRRAELPDAETFEEPHKGVVEAASEVEAVEDAAPAEKRELTSAGQQEWAEADDELPSPLQRIEEPMTSEAVEPVVAHAWEREEDVYAPQPEIGEEPISEPVMAQVVAEDAVEEVSPESAEQRAPQPLAEVHTPVKLRWTVRDLHHDELERELNDDQAAVPVAATETPLPPAATLLGELRSRAAAMPTREESGVQKHPSGRRSGAPVEERLEPRVAGLTRRWEMLSRFDATSADREADAETPRAGS